MSFQWIMVLSLALTVTARGAELVLKYGAAGADVTPPGFTNVLAGGGAPGRWRAVVDLGPNGTNQAVLAQTSVDVKDEHFPMLIYNRHKFDDFKLTAKFKIVEGVAEQMAGVVFRYQDEKDFYVVRASALGSNLRFYKVVGGIRSQPIGPSIPITKGVWYELKIECRKNKIRTWLDGHEAIPELTDTSFAEGKIGFWTKSDSQSRFADCRIDYTPREAFAQVVVRDALREYSRLIGLKIYLADETGTPRVVASKDPKDIGAAGGTSEQGAITKGQVFYGKEKRTVSVVQPLRDRNGDPIAAVRIVMESYIGQTEQAVLQRALPIARFLQARVGSVDELQ